MQARAFKPEIPNRYVSGSTEKIQFVKLPEGSPFKLQKCADYQPNGKIGDGCGFRTKVNCTQKTSSSTDQEEILTYRPQNRSSRLIRFHCLWNDLFLTLFSLSSFTLILNENNQCSSREMDWPYFRTVFPSSGEGKGAVKLQKRKKLVLLKEYFHNCFVKPKLSISLYSFFKNIVKKQFYQWTWLKFIQVSCDLTVLSKFLRLSKVSSAYESKHLAYNPILKAGLMLTTCINFHGIVIPVETWSRQQ